jgi:hypothetical protein
MGRIGTMGFRVSAGFRAALLVTGMAAAISPSPAQAGFVVGSSAALIATDNFFSSVVINDPAETVGASTQFFATQILAGAITSTLTWTARIDADTITIQLATSRGLEMSGAPRDTFDFTGLSLTPGVSLSSLVLQSETDFNATILSTGANSLSIGINSVDTRADPDLLATVVFALPSVPESVPEPSSLAIFGTALAGFGLLRRRKDLSSGRA